MEIIILGGTSTPLGYMKTAGIYRIASELRNAGFTVQTLDRILTCSDEYLNSFLEAMISDETLLLGFSTTMLQTSNADYSHNIDGYQYFGFSDDKFKKLIKFARHLNPDLKIMIGGSQVESENVTAISQFSSYIDYCIKGQGDRAVVALANHLKYGDDIEFSHIEGFQFIDDKSYPVNDFDSIEIEYHENDAVASGEATTIEIARGCVFKCKFCTYDLIGKSWGDMIKSRRSLIDEMERNYAEHGISTYICSDDTLNDSLEKVQFLHDVFTSLSFRPTFSGYFRLDILAKFREQARLLKECGVWSMNFGIETMDKKAGALMGKGMGAERIKEALDFLKEEFQDEVVLTANFIIGLPGESIESMYHTLAYLLDPGCPLHGGNFRPLNLSRHIKGYNSALFKEAEKFGYVVDDDTDYWRSPILDYTKATEITHLIFRALEARKNPHYKLIHTFKINRLLNLGYSREEIMSMVRNQPTADFSRNEVLRRTREAHDNYFTTLINRVQSSTVLSRKDRLSDVILPTSRGKGKLTPRFMAGITMNERKVANPEDFISRFEYSKFTSNYHFDDTVDDDNDQPYKRIGRFVGEWQDEIQAMASAVRPNTYHGRMGANNTPYLDRLETNDLVNMGVGKNHVLHNKSIFKKLTPKFQKMIDSFGFDQEQGITYNFHVQMPGQVFIKHIDSCTSIRGNNSTDDANYYFKHPEKIARFIIALEDWTMGHMWAYGNTYWKQWTAGDIVYHSWIDIPHATANASHVPRYTIQVTGHVTEKTREIIRSDDYIYINI